MWDYFRGQQERGRTPTGAELDRVAGTGHVCWGGRPYATPADVTLRPKAVDAASALLMML